MTDNFERALRERLLARSEVSPRDVEALRLFARTLPTRRPSWRRPVAQLVLAGAAVALAAAVALPDLLHIPSVGTQSPVPTTAAPATPVPPTPSATPDNGPTPAVGLGPIRLATASGSIVNVSIDSPDVLITGAVAEQAQATMSVRWFDSLVEQAGPNSIRVTWVGYPIDENVELQVSILSAGVTGTAAKLQLHFVQKAPPAQSDAQGEDRVLVLTFATAIDANSVEVTFSR